MLVENIFIIPRSYTSKSGWYKYLFYWLYFALRLEDYDSAICDVTMLKMTKAVLSYDNVNVDLSLTCNIFETFP